MVKHGSSHSLSVLICTIIAALLVDLLRPYFPQLVSHLAVVSEWFIINLPLPFSADQFNIILVASFLAMIWGVFFKLSIRKSP